MDTHERPAAEALPVPISTSLAKQCAGGARRRGQLDHHVTTTIRWQSHGQLHMLQVADWLATGRAAWRHLQVGHKCVWLSDKIVIAFPVRKEFKTCKIIRTCRILSFYKDHFMFNCNFLCEETPAGFTMILSFWYNTVYICGIWSWLYDTTLTVV